MRILAFIISGIGLIAAWPFALAMTGSAQVQPEVSAEGGFARGAIALTLFAVPLVWLVSAVAAVVVHFGMKVPVRPVAGDTDADLAQEAAIRRSTRSRKGQLLNRLAAAPYVAATLHLATWGILAIVGR